MEHRGIRNRGKERGEKIEEMLKLKAKKNNVVMNTKKKERKNQEI